MNDTEQEVAARKVADHIIEDLMYEPIPPLDLQAAALEITNEITEANPEETENIARLAAKLVSNDSRVRATRTLAGNIMWFERKTG